MGDEHPIAYGSRKLLPRETKYLVIEREGLAIVEGVKHFRVYLEGGRRNGNADGLSREHGSRLEEGEMSVTALLSLTSQP